MVFSPHLIYFNLSWDYPNKCRKINKIITIIKVMSEYNIIPYHRNKCFKSSMSLLQELIECNYHRYIIKNIKHSSSISLSIFPLKLYIFKIQNVPVVSISPRVIDDTEESLAELRERLALNSRLYLRNHSHKHHY